MKYKDSKHIGFPTDRLELVVEVLKIDLRYDEFGTLGDHTLLTEEGNLLFWTASKQSTWLEVGKTYRVRATVAMHDRDEDNCMRTIVMRVSERKTPVTPPRIPRVSIGLRKKR